MFFGPRDLGFYLDPPMSLLLGLWNQSSNSKKHTEPNRNCIESLFPNRSLLLFKASGFRDDMLGVLFKNLN